MESKFCAEAQGNCLRCQTTGRQDVRENAALLLGPIDKDADATLRQALNANALTYIEQGPVLILPDIHTQREAVAACLREHLTAYTRDSVRAAIAPDGANTPETVLSAFFHAETLTRLLEQMENEWVRDVLGDNWLFSVFHPIITALSGETFAYEALIRARNPETQAVIGAGPIIDACSKLNLQHQLDQNARRSAIFNAAALQLPDARFFINFLPNTIYDPKICLRTTMEAAQEAGLAMSQLVFEVVETEQIPDMKRLRYILDYYQERGVGTAIDDMGAGFSSVDYLTALKPDYMKLDRDILLEAERDSAARNRMDSLISLSHRLGIKVIAEGIETPEQMRICQESGADFLQGFLFARPANPPQEVATQHFASYAAAA